MHYLSPSHSYISLFFFIGQASTIVLINLPFFLEFVLFMHYRYFSIVFFPFCSFIISHTLSPSFIIHYSFLLVQVSTIVLINLQLLNISSFYVLHSLFIISFLFCNFVVISSTPHSLLLGQASTIVLINM